MTKLPRYTVGQKVRAIRPIFDPIEKKEYPTGTIGYISAVTVDATVGWYVIQFLGNDGMLLPLPPHPDSALVLV